MLSLRRLPLTTILVLALAAAVVAWRAPSWTDQLIERRLGALLGREVTVESVHFTLFPFRAEVRGLRVAGLHAGDPPFLDVPQALLAPSIRPLWEQRLDLYELRVVRPQVRVRAYAAGGDDIPRLRLGGQGSAELRVRRLVIEGGELWVNHQRVPLDLDLPAFEGRLVQRGPGMLGGRVAFGPGDARFGKAPPISLRTTMDLALKDGLVSIESARLLGPQTDLVYRGQLRFTPGIRADLELSGAVDLGIVDRHVLATGFDLEGAAHFQGWARLENSRVRLGGRLSGTDGRFDGLAVKRFSGDVGWDAEGVHLRDFAASFLDGGGTFEVDVPPAPGDTTLRASLKGVDAERLAAYLFDIGRPGLGAAADLETSLRWPRGRIRALSGTLAAELTPRADGRTPLSGRFVWHAQSGTQFVDEADLRTPEAEARVAGRIETGGQADLAVEASSSDLERGDALSVRVREALHADAPQPVGWSGAGAFSGRWRGTLSRPVWEGRFTGHDVGFLGVQWGRAEGAGSADADRIRMDQVVVKKGGGELRLDGWMETGLPGEADALDLRVHVLGWPAPDFTRALAWDVALEGAMSGDADLRGRRSAPEGTASFASPAGTFTGVPFEALQVAAVLRGGQAEVTSGSATMMGGRVSFKGTVREDGVWDGEAAAEGIDVARVAARAGFSAPWQGRLSGRGTLVGSLDHPRGLGHVDGMALAIGAEALGPLRADLSGAGDGALQLAAALDSERVPLTIAGRVGAAPPFDADLQATLRRAVLDPFLRAAGAGFPPTVGLSAAATLALRGPLGRPRALAGEASVTSMELRLPDYPVVNRGPLVATLRDGTLALARFHLAGEGTDLAVAGSAGLLDDGALDVAVEGTADLRTVSLVSPELRGHGATRLQMTVSGPRRRPQVAGTIDLDGDGVRVRGFPHGLEDVRGRVTFDARSAQMAGVTATLGGGVVELSGQAAHEHGRLASFDVQAAGREMALRYPEGLKSTVDADLRFFGDSGRQWLTGTVDVREAVWTRRYDVASEILAAAPAVSGGDPGLGGGVHFDVKVRAPGTLRIDNNLAALTARADLALQGTFGAPVVLGRAEIDRGRIYFQGNTYVIRRGTIDFSNPQKIDPLFDVEAEARVRSYNVVLKTQGTLERVTPTLTSDPPLSTVSILSLLAGADEGDVERATEFRERTDLAAAGAATLAAGRISEQFGLERRASRLGLNRFSIDPTVGVRGEYRNPGVRLTAGKRLTPDLSVVYSQDLRGTDEHLLSVEYSLSDKVSVLLTRAAPGGLGFDVRLRRNQ